MPRFSTVVCYKGRGFDSRVVTGIVPELGQWQEETALLWARMNKASQVDLQALVDAFYLTISLGVVWYTHVQFRTNDSKQFLPKVASEDWVSIRYNSLG